jgi:hypothetical protein
MVRGIERTSIFRDDTDRANFLARLASLAESGALTVYAWALLPNHAHPLRTVPRARQATGNILAQFGATAPRARRAIDSWWLRPLGQLTRAGRPAFGPYSGGGAVTAM